MTPKAINARRRSKRRHIRCDESYPQCQNCTKHKVRCAFHDAGSHYEAQLQDTVPGLDTEPGTTVKPSRRWPAKVRAEVRQWRRTEVLPIPDFGDRIQVQPALYSDDELCYIYHAAKLNHQLMVIEAHHLTIMTVYAPSFFGIASKSRLVMNGLLALSASQVAFSSNCGFARHRAYQYQMLAIKDLQQALGTFSHDNADDVLAASMALLWLSEDMHSRSQISRGITAILKICHDWGFESDLFKLISNSWTGSANKPNKSSTVNNTYPHLARVFKFNVLQRITIEMQKLRASLQHRELMDENAKRLQLLIVLAQNLSSLDPSAPANEQFEHMRLLRDYALWIPVCGLLAGNDLPSALLINAYLYIMVIQVYRQFPRAYMLDVGGDMISLLEETLRRVAATGDYGASLADTQTLLSMMELPIHLGR
ncbi:hypothetical protein FALBO_7376 [Fusarium albosuccineum]|uniref:Zn(2)-C6 fungal-type domain-containing protein n=1 Tax=Fusarium albosuccineum TaxID=1237068 RepID=A0A8H4LAB7_9HYPO|nr:hypothetical protein FALBO_7376 [Fusarium albosuccineum]